MTVFTHRRPSDTTGALRELIAAAGAVGVTLRLDAEETRKHPGLQPGLGVELNAPVLDDVELCIVLGGDGTILRALRRYAGTSVPVFAVNFGEIGFLATIEPGELREGAARAFSGEFELLQLPAIVLDGPEPPVRIATEPGSDSEPGLGSEPKLESDSESGLESRQELESDAGPGLESQSGSGQGLEPEPDVEQGVRAGINDVAIHRKVGERVAEIAYALEGEVVGSVRCDGLVIATPAGSTGYNLANGGPVMAWGVEGFAVSFIAPHSLTARALVVAPGDRLTIHNRSREPLDIAVDGRPAGEIPAGGAIDARFMDAIGTIAQLPDSSFYRRLREKFGRLAS